MPTIELEPVVDRVKHAIRDTELPTMDQVKPTIDQLRKELATFDPQELPLPAVVLERLPERSRPVWPGRLILALGLALLALALMPVVRRRAGEVVEAMRQRASEMTSDKQPEPVAFPATPTAQVRDDPFIPGSPAPLPEGLGSERNEQHTDTPLVETAR